MLAAVLTAATAPAVAANRPAVPRVEFLGSGVVRGDLGAVSGTPLQTAYAALRAQAPALGVDAETFRFDTVRTSPVGTHVRGRQYRSGVPVARSAAAVQLIRGRVVQVEARAPRLPGRPAARPVPRAAAVAAALAHVGVRTPLKVSAERVLAPSASRLVDTWQVAVASLQPAVAARVDVDAATGRALATVDDLRHVEGTAKVFDPNPIVASRDSGLRQPAETGLPADADLDDPKLSSSRVVLPLRDLDAAALQAGRLVGPWVHVIAGGYHSVGAPAFDITRGDPRFEGLMAYAHLDRTQRYFQSLGFSDVNAESQEVVATRVEGFDNSFYQPGNDLMLLGTGGVDDGEDAEVIIHEYGHAVQDAQVKGWGATHEGGAMGEGFGDFLAAAVYGRSVSRGFQDECIMDWDATSYDDGDPACLRRTDSKKRYPADMTNTSVHSDGEIWSTFLWRLRSRLGRGSAERSDNVMRLVLASQELVTPEANFGDAVAALRLAAQGLGRASWTRDIDAEARRSGLPLNP